MGKHAHDLADGWKLWTRGGTNDVSIEYGEVAVAIPQELLRMLVADDIRSQRVSKLEQMEDDEILGLEHSYP